MANSTNAPFFVDTEVIRLTRNGVWMSDSTEIDHEGTRRMFAKILARDEQGYFLRVGSEFKRIEVEDTAFFVHRVEGSPEKGYTLWLNDETQEPLDPATLKYQPGRLTCSVRKLGGLEDAKFLHAAYFDLLTNLEENTREYFLEIQGVRVILMTKN